MTIRVCFGKDKGFKGKLICAVTGSSLSHSWVEYISGVWGGSWVAHSNHRGVVKEPVENVRKKYPTYRIYESDFDFSRGLIAARRHVGTADYDYITVFWNIILFLLKRYTGLAKLQDYALINTSKQTCSEFVAEILKNAELPGTLDISPELQTTGNVEDIVLKSGLFQLVEEKRWPEDY
jgi:hypothetical protein